MNKFTLSLFLSFFITINAIGQIDAFNWEEDLFPIGQTKELNFQFDFDGPCSVAPCEKFEINAQTLNALNQFLNNNPNLIIEIGSHSDQRGTHRYNRRLTQNYAQGIKDKLGSMGIEEERIIAIGYGGTVPIISTEEIDQMESEADKEKAYQKNSRFEIRIVGRQ